MLLMAALLPCAALGGEVSREKIDFNRDIRPILSGNCFKCHGFDDKARKADRRLDTREGALAEKDGVRAIVPGNLAESDFSARIHSTEKDEQMPPQKSGKKLTTAQIAFLDRWIQQGADYKLHWAFEKPRQAEPPALADDEAQIADLAKRDPVAARQLADKEGEWSHWARNPIDQFVLARMLGEGLAPSPEADSATLCRRLSLDLIGLPPTPEEADEFQRSAALDPQSAIKKLVDRLLDSPHYGERWARKWLDLARYSDTNGYEKDRERTIWPYRDWVIHALNEGMPFDEFTIEQIAGDLLPDATREQRIATGFHRNTMLNEEGGIDPLEYRYLATVDRVATTGTTWLGLTIQCAQCHTHKYDPIPHREYYQFMAFLNNADEPALDLPPPNAAEEDAARQKKLEQLIAQLPEKFPEGADPAARRNAAEEKFREWLEEQRSLNVEWIPLRPIETHANLPLLTVQDDNSVFVSGDMTKRDLYELKFHTDLHGISAVRLEVLADDRLPNHGPGRIFYEGSNGDFFLSEFSLWNGEKHIPFVRATASFAKKKFEIGKAIDGDPQSGWSIDGGQGRNHEAVFNLGAPLQDSGEFTIKILCERYFAAGLGKFRISATTDTRGAQAREMPPEVASLLRVPDAELTPEQRGQVRRQFLLSTPELAAARGEIDALRRPLPQPQTLVFQERPPENPRPTFIHHRGEFLQLEEKVEPGVLSALQPFPADAPRNRLGFARWLVSPDNPLTARVTMNREWAAFFGRGIVRTLGDFGFQGDPPTHPELLDWLAVEFMKGGWSIKQMQKLIVMSATYRQSSRVAPDLLAKDPENAFLARGARFRLDAELIRDATLRASGLLSEKIGGPSVRPPQPVGVTEAAYGSPKWTPSEGEDRYRRSLYTFSKRTAPFALYNAFDAPTGDACLARRDVSNTPLQALELLNDVVFLEASRALGEKLATLSGTTEDRITEAFRRCLTRAPDAGEMAMVEKYFLAQKDRFERGELDAAALLGAKPENAAERAAWTTVARALFNLDEAITKS